MINKLLKSCLQRNKRLVIPSLGAFIRRKIDGVGTILVFVPFLREDDRILFTAIKSWAGVEDAEAQIILDEYVAAIKNSLSERKQYIIDGIGVLKFDINNILYLAKLSEAVVAEPRAASPLVEEAVTASEQEDVVDDVEEPIVETAKVEDGSAREQVNFHTEDEFSDEAIIKATEDTKEELEQPIVGDSIADNPVFDELNEPDEPQKYISDIPKVKEVVYQAPKAEPLPTVTTVTTVITDQAVVPTSQPEKSEQPEPYKPQSHYQRDDYEDYVIGRGRFKSVEGQERNEHSSARENGGSINSGVGARYFNPLRQENQQPPLSREVTQPVSSSVDSTNSKSVAVEQSMADKKSKVASIYGNSGSNSSSNPVHRTNQQRISDIYGGSSANTTTTEPSRVKQPKKVVKKVKKSPNKGNGTPGKKGKSSDAVLIIAIVAVLVTIGVLIYGFIYGSGETVLEEISMPDSSLVQTPVDAQ